MVLSHLVLGITCSSPTIKDLDSNLVVTSMLQIMLEIGSAFVRRENEGRPPPSHTHTPRSRLWLHPNTTPGAYPDARLQGEWCFGSCNLSLAKVH